MTRLDTPNHSAAADQFSDPIAPLRIALRAHYEILRQIGQGAFATVYLARDLKHERQVAIKVLNTDPTSETGELRFIREIRTVARLQHPNILPLHDSGHVEALLYYVMPYVSGETLRDRIDRERQLPLDAACNIARELGDALAYAHREGVIHRDIKPENVLLSTGHPILSDFGIARVIDLAGVRQLTRTGAGSPGTPAYMSPEQLLGDKQIDGRSDTYSLACVLYEMLVGKPPFAGKEGFVKRFTEPPPRVSLVRREAPPWLDEALMRAMDRDPANRYPTAREFVSAMCAPAPAGRSAAIAPIARGTQISGEDRESPALQPVGVNSFSDARTLVRRFPRSLAAASLAALGLIAVFALSREFGSSWRSTLFGETTPYNSAKVLILPLRGDRASGELFARRLRDSWSKWNGLYVVSDLEVADALRANGAVASLADARRLARGLGAGKLVWGEVSSPGGDDPTKLELYDESAEPTSGARFYSIDGERSLQSELTASALALLKDPARPAAADGGDGGTHSYSAWQSYGAGHVALGKWDLAGATRHFSESVNSDPQFAAARLWLAQVSSWTDPSSRWREHARFAALGKHALSSRDFLLADGLVGLAEKQFPRACASYRTLTASDSVDFVAWYGLGQCQSQDNAVLAEANSPSGRRFRSSYYSAALAYQRAFRLAPAMHSLMSSYALERLMPTTPAMPRWGQDEKGNYFMAYPTLLTDTLAFVPYSEATFADGLPLSAMTALSSALGRDITARHDMALDWVQHAPNDPAAHEALADILETKGDLTDDANRSNSAITELQRAQALATSDEQRVRLTASEVRLQFKLGNFSRARSLADSLLNQHKTANASEAGELAAMAALTGKVERLADLIRVGGFDTASVEIPGQLQEIGANLFAQTALGVCDGGVADLRRTLAQRLDSYAVPEHRAELLISLEQRPLSFDVPCTHGASALDIPSPADRLYAMQQAYARGQTAAVRNGLKTLAAVRRGLRPGDVSLDYTYQESWLEAAIGDTAQAIARLDRTLNAMPTLGATALKQPAAAAAAGRMMMLRAQLALAAGDPRAAKRWAAGVVALWRDADQSLQPAVARMKTIAAGNPN